MKYTIINMIIVKRHMMDGMKKYVLFALSMESFGKREGRI